MKLATHLKKLLSVLLVAVMLVGSMPVSAFAAEEPIVLLGGGDYQQAGSHTNSADNVSNILDRITDAGFTGMDGFLFVGDYDCETHDSSSETAAGISSLMDTVSGYYGNINHSNSILVQGNHDYPNANIDATGGHDFNGYSVFVMNEDDYPNGGGSELQARNLAQELDEFLAAKLNAGYTAPIFITSHVPLHFGPRTNRQGDGKYAGYLFDVLNSYGAEGLNIIFMHGHNHAYGYDEYLGGEAIYLAVGDSINIAKTGSQSSYETHTLQFTYMNAGYTGYYNESGYSTSSGTNFLTMTVFEIYGDRVEISRYSENGLYQLKSAGQLKGDYINSVSVSANTKAYASSQTVTLKAPAERVTLTDSATGVSVTGVKNQGSFDDNSDLSVTGVLSVDILDHSAKCAAYQAYDLTFTSDEAVSISLPVPADYVQSRTKVYCINGTTMTQMDATFSGAAATFSADHDGLFAVVHEYSGSSSPASVYYQRVESVSELVSGKEYLILFDCSTQTTADAIVIPEIATYSSGSSLRKGPDVIVSDGLTDESILTGDYDQYLWTLTSSGSGWKIGDGSQNINVTYNSTSGRCELAFTASGEALTIAAGSSNPSDADSYSFAVSDSSGYYWQYNTSATLIYGTTSDSYRSRFCFYQKVENTDTETEVPNGWIELPAGGTYVLDTNGVDMGADNKYILVDSSGNYALTLSNGSIGSTAVTISGNTAKLEDPAASEFYFAKNSAESSSYLLTQDGANTVYHANGYLYYGSDNKGYWHVGSSSGGAYQLYDYDNLNWYLNYGYVWGSEAVSRFAVSSTARTVRLFKSTGSVYADTYVRLAGQTQQSCTTADKATAADILSAAHLEITSDGYTVSQTVALTEAMATWSSAFDGTTAGTYTAVITYQGVRVGTVSVTVSNAHTHSYTVVETAPTCTADGSRVYTCACGHSYTETIAALGHSYNAVTTQPTCTEEGKTVYTCHCGHTYTEVIPATGKHEYSAVVTAPTCTAEGYTTYTCACGDSYIADIVAALGHSYTSVTTEPTCVKEGKTVYTCACGETYTEVIPATGKHEYSAVVTAPTCTEEGYTTYTCADCDDSYIADTVAALGHTYTSVTTQPTCVKEGKTVYTCACGETYTEVIPATGKHEYTAVVTAPTCTAEGYTTYTCACGDTYTADIVAALGHKYSAKVTAPTCTAEGYTTYTCACGDSYIADIVAALGHEYSAVVTAPTCTKDGYTTYTCACGDTYTADIVAALGHDYRTVVTAPTCTKDGYTTYICATCGDTYTADTVAALGHDYSAVVTAPTCTEGGYTTYTCACGDSYTADAVAATGHSYTVVETDTELVYTCHCGHSYTEQLVTEVEYTKVSRLSDGRYVITMVSGSKYYALSHEDNKISAVRVTVSNNVITSEITEDLVWEYSNNVLSYKSNGTTYYLHAQSSNSWWGWGTPTLTLSTSQSTSVSFSSNKLKMGSYYLRYSSNKISLNRSASTAGLFAETAK